MKRIGIASVVLAVALLTMTGSAWAEASTHCVKATKVGKKFTGGYVDKNCTAASAKHEGKYEYIKASTLSEPEQEELKALLKYVKVVPSGVASKPTVQVSGANVQIVSGAGKTNAAVNGEGNLVIGYDENPEKHEQTGSHDLILGEEQTFTSYGGLVAGEKNTVSGAFASVSGGGGNTASRFISSVSGGLGNTASGQWSSVSGGEANTASGGIPGAAWVGGGAKNTASGPNSSITAGANNEASGSFTSVTGGQQNTATSSSSWAGGGFQNHSAGSFTAIFGGKELEAKNAYEALPACVAPGKAGELC
jgi:hypothetical protein